MILAIYSYLGYYNACNIGDEVHDPGRTIPRSILGSVVLVFALFVALHLAMLGTIPWTDVPTNPTNYSLAADFMRRIHGDGAAAVVTVLLIWSCLGSVFAGMFGYSRVPYGAARNGHFFAAFTRVHPRHRIPALSLLLVGGLTLVWGLFSLDNLIKALITTRILEQFIGQAAGVVLLRRRRPDLYRPFKMWLYPLPSLLALVGWLYVYLSAGLFYILLGAATLIVGALVFLVWAWRQREWPFGPARIAGEVAP
jgi:amino acid transporter